MFCHFLKKQESVFRLSLNATYSFLMLLANTLQKSTIHLYVIDLIGAKGVLHQVIGDKHSDQA